MQKVAAVLWGASLLLLVPTAAAQSGSGSGISALPPSNPVIIVTARSTASLSFAWPPPEGEVVDYYEIATAYVGDCLEVANEFPGSSAENFEKTEVTFSELQEFSTYSLNVTAVNNNRSSETSTLVATTLPAAPSGTVENLEATALPSSVTLEWDRVPCLTRNGEITGYQVTFGPTSSSSRTTKVLNGVETRRFNVSGLIPRTEYTFQVTPLSLSGNGLTAPTNIETTLPSEVMFQLRGVFYRSHSIIDPATISTGSNSLLCITTSEACCSDTGAGQWFFPDGTAVPIGNLNPYYITRGSSVVRFNRGSFSTTSPGLYRCEVPVTSGTENVYIGLYPVGQGAPAISAEGIEFSRESLSLTCVSSGGPVNSVQWTRDDNIVSTNYTITVNLTDAATATYTSVLTANSINDLVGEFSCSLGNGREQPDTAEIVLNGVQIFSDGAQYTVGSTATLSCASDAVATIEWLIGDTQVNVTTSSTTLDYVLNPVTDDLHENTLVCRVNRTTLNGDVRSTSQSIVLTVIVPRDAVSVLTSASGVPIAGNEYSLSCMVSKNVGGLTGESTAVWMDSNGDVMESNGITLTTSTNGTYLMFNPLRATNADTYTCVGSLSSPAQLTPLTVSQQQRVEVTLPPPGVSLSLLPSSLIAGTPLTLTCTITLDSAINVNVVVEIASEITTDGDPITSNYDTATDSTTQSLSIPVLSTTYSNIACRAFVRRPSTDPFVLTSNRGMASVPIAVQVPPRPVVEITMTGNSVAGSSLSLLCTATTPTPLVAPPTVAWMSVVETDGITVTNNMMISMSTANVTFDPLRTSDGRDYVCIADYNIPEANLPNLNSTDSTSVTVQIPRPEATIVADPEMDRYVVGSGLLMLRFVVTFSTALNTPISFVPIWRREGVVLPNNYSSTSMTDNNVYTSTLNVQLLTSGNNTVYECEATIMAQDNPFVTEITVNSSNTISVDEATFEMYLTPDTTVLAGNNHTLNCTAIREEAQGLVSSLTVEWFDPDGQRITSETNGFTIDGVISSTSDARLESYLRFPSVNTSQAGPYTCRVNHTSPVVSQSLTRTSVVRVNIPPLDADVIYRTPVYHGANHTFNCEAVLTTSAVDTAVSLMYWWSGPNGPLETGNGVIFSQDNSSLTLSPVGPPQMSSGYYVCLYTVLPTSSPYVNQVSGNATVNVPVLGPLPPSVSISSIKRDNSCGPVLSITATAYINVLNFVATPSVMWFRPDGEIATTNNTLYFTNLTTSSNGEYVFEACVTVESVDINNLCSNASVSVLNTLSDPVRDLTCTSVPPSSININWSPPSNPVLNYQVEVQRYVGADSTEPVADKSEIESTTSIMNLERGVRYLVRVEATSSVSCSSIESVECYSEEGISPAVDGVTTVRLNGTAMRVSWTRLSKAESRGFITNYTITYLQVTENAKRRRQGPQMVHVSGDSDTVVITGLDPELAYTASVTATTVAGTSEPSSEVLTPPVTQADDGNNTSVVGAVVGGIVGAILFIIILAVVITICFECCRRKKKVIIHTTAKSKFDLEPSLVLQNMTSLGDMDSYVPAPEPLKDISTFQQAAAGDEVKPNDVPSATVESNGQ